MNIYLRCQAVERKPDGTFQCKFFHIPHEQNQIDIVLNSPPMPGELYEIRIYGKFPGYNSGLPCSSEIVEMCCREYLRAMSVTELDDWRQKEKAQ